MNPQVAFPIKSPNRNRIGASEVNDLRLGYRNARMAGEVHRCVFDEWRIDWLAVEELHDPLLAAHFNKSFRLRTAKAASGAHDPRFYFVEGLRSLNFCDHLAQVLHLREQRKWAAAARAVGSCRGGNAESTEPLVAGIVEILHERQTLRSIEKTDYLLTPTIRTSIVNRADRALAVRC